MLRGCADVFCIYSSVCRACYCPVPPQSCDNGSIMYKHSGITMYRLWGVWLPAMLTGFDGCAACCADVCAGRGCPLLGARCGLGGSLLNKIWSGCGHWLPANFAVFLGFKTLRSHFLVPKRGFAGATVALPVSSGRGRRLPEGSAVRSVLHWLSHVGKGFLVRLLIGKGLLAATRSCRKAPQFAVSVIGCHMWGKVFSTDCGLARACLLPLGAVCQWQHCC